MIELLIKRSESKTLEFKENTKSLANIIKTVIAFANTAGGTIVIGVQDRTKKLIGLLNVLDEEERLVNAISDAVAPLLIPNIEIHNYDQKEFILIYVPHVAGPYYLKSSGQEHGTYVRIGSTSRLADAETLESLKLFAKKMTFDEIAYARAGVDVLDWCVIKKIFAENHKKITESKAEDLGLLVQQANQLRPSYGGIILFGTHRLRVFPDAIVKCVRFLGLNKVNVLDHLEITTYPILAIDEILHFVRKNTRMGAQFGQMVRVDVPEYPDIAVREVVINALLHADYAINGSSIMVAIYDDRLEVTSPGGMPIGMTLERALAGSSRVRNRVIARVFREVGLSEQWGSGLQRIIDACARRGLETPLFQDLDKEFKVTLYATAQKMRVPEPAHEKFIKHVRKQGGSVNTQKAAAFWHITPRNARVRLKKLMEAGVVHRVGTSAKDPRGVYVLVGNHKK